MTIGSKIRKLRIDRNVSQQSVADSLGIDRRTYAAWEMNSQDIKSNFIPKLADFFGVEISELFNQDKDISINQHFKNSTINTAVLILTDKDSISKVLDAIKGIQF